MEEGTIMNSEQMKLLRAKHYALEGAKAGFKAAAIAGIAAAIPTMIGVRAIPWARANLNYAAQALIISTASGSAYFVAADKAILKSARQHAFSQLHEDDPLFS
eukprot:TRINITY_DN15218_c0_g1_i1.p1 TRINITY_DN15218_c0_g1~~TRINITY_DN15218_c0_g1_i1.p1  ORF type:complete len:103 (-),score=22.03 TRINITY_DN15218_c0_g1_i1:208-516(-)